MRSRSVVSSIFPKPLLSTLNVVRDGSRYLLSGDHTYRETHNALQAALDELRIMALLGHKADKYSPINK